MTTSPRCAIVAIGTELTMGQVADTNSRFLAQGLLQLGCTVAHMHAIPDDRALMQQLIARCAEEYDVTIITGGLGPTSDDFTREVLLSLFGGTLQVDEETLHRIEERFQRRQLPLTDRNRDQARVPSTCTVLQNHCGTAPGMLFHRGSHMVFSLPGVPFEMEWLFQHQVAPCIERLPRPAILHRTLKIYGIAESFLADTLADWESRLRQHFALAYLPGPEGIRLRIDSLGESTPDLVNELANLTVELKTLVSDKLYGEGDDTLPGIVARILASEGLSVACAESCTAGSLAATFTELPGASIYFRGGIVAYSEAVKISLLDVPSSMLAEHGAVSQPVAECMAQAARDKLGADYALATTGLLGPEGDGSDTPVGTVWLALADHAGVHSQCLTVNVPRHIGRVRTVYEAVNMLRLRLLEAYPHHRYNPREDTPFAC